MLYDIRNVPADELGGALKNVRTLAHEATHQLTFNTGLLNPRGDVPVSIIEGLACYGETRRLRGRNEPGLLNSPRLDDLAHVQRRAKWISIVRSAHRRCTGLGSQHRSDAALLRPELAADLLPDELARSGCPSFKRTSRPFFPGSTRNTGSTTPQSASGISIDWIRSCAERPFDSSKNPGPECGLRGRDPLLLHRSVLVPRISIDDAAADRLGEADIGQADGFGGLTGFDAIERRFRKRSFFSTRWIES